jgi:hypothetical protein
MIRASIFLSIASYCDPMLDFTLTSARAQAADPDRLFIGLVDQGHASSWHRLRDEWSRTHVRTVRIDAIDSRGPCWARALAMSLYQGEDWFLQIDSHTWFEPGWDQRLMNWGHRCTCMNQRSLLTCYPNSFVVSDGQPVAQGVTQKVLAHVVKDDSQFHAAHPVLMFEGVGVETDEPVPGFHVAGGCLFGPGRVVNELPYDPGLYFHGEEQAFALRAWTRGWDIWHVPGMPMYHLYTQPESVPRPMHWSADVDQRRTVGSAELEKAAQTRLSAMLWGGADFGAYGLGSARSLSEFAAFSGIDYQARSIAPKARKSRFGY